jgi:hypothetical protein
MGLPPDDPLRFDKSGRRLPEKELGVLLEGIIKSWETWDWGAPKSPPERKASLSGERASLSGGKEPGRRRQWLSR